MVFTEEMRDLLIDSFKEFSELKSESKEITNEIKDMFHAFAIAQMQNVNLKIKDKKKKVSDYCKEKLLEDLQKSSCIGIAELREEDLQLSEVNKQHLKTLYKQFTSKDSEKETLKEHMNDLCDSIAKQINVDKNVVTAFFNDRLKKLKGTSNLDILVDLVAFVDS